MRTKTSYSSTLFIIFLVAIIIAGVDLYRYAYRPVYPQNPSGVIVIRSGQGFSEITEILYQQGFITDTFKFKILARILEYDKQIKAGEYQFTSAVSPQDILKTLVKGGVLSHALTIPEGSNLNQIAEIIESGGFGKKDEFFKVATDPNTVRSKGIDAESFEGYLFPDTYRVSKNVTPEKIIDTMLKRFWQIFTDEWKLRAGELGYSVHQVVTLASIIEKEAGTPLEFPLIGSVFYNRLKLRMRLQSDPTVIYGIKNYDGNITRGHLREPTLYNTYIINGLPPGPIANPGRGAIEAALYPADTSYLYFVSKGDGTHHFSKSLREHNQAVRKYQIKR